jgi:hypothetical protein
MNLKSFALKLVAQNKEIDLRHVLTDDDIAALQRRNEERIAAARAKMGNRWAAHPNSTWEPKGKTVLEPYRRKLGT